MYRKLDGRAATADEQRPLKMSPEKKKRALQVTEVGLLALASITFLALLIASGLAASPDADRYGFKNGTGDISDEFETQVTPAGFTFSIWGVIYAWQVLWLGYAWSFICRPKAPRTIAIVVYPIFAVSSVLTTSWLFVWGNELVNWAFGILAAFDIVIYITISVLTFFFFASMTEASKVDVILTKVLVVNGLCFYATWTTIAGLINFGVVLQYTADVNAATVGTVLLALLTTVVLIYFALENTVLDRYIRDVFAVYPVVIWALIGVVVKHWNEPGEERNSIFALVLLLVTVVLLIIRIVLIILFYLFRKRGGRAQSKCI